MTVTPDAFIHASEEERQQALQEVISEIAREREIVGPRELNERWFARVIEKAAA